MPAFKGTTMKPAPGRNPAHFGEIAGFPVGSRWPGRRELCDDGVHAPLTGGIHGRTREGAFSVVLSGGYEDDIDLGYEFTYTGQGGRRRRESGIKWDSVQIKDQEWTRGNLALAISWRLKTRVRVIRGHTLPSAYAPSEGYRYDGLYTVEDANMKKGKSGFNVCLFHFVRCPNQLPLPGPITTLPIRQKENQLIQPTVQSEAEESIDSDINESDSELQSFQAQQIQACKLESQDTIIQAKSLKSANLKLTKSNNQILASKLIQSTSQSINQINNFKPVELPLKSITITSTITESESQNLDYE